jgi:hypothetical protein
MADVLPEVPAAVPVEAPEVTLEAPEVVALETSEAIDTPEVALEAPEAPEVVALEAPEGAEVVALEVGVQPEDAIDGVAESDTTPDLSDEVDVRAYEEDPDPTEEYEEDGGFVVKDAELEEVLESERVLHAAAEITVRNVLPEGQKRARRAPQRYEPVETPVDDVDRPSKRRKTGSEKTSVDTNEGQEEEEEAEEDEDEDEEDEEDEEDDDEDYDEAEEESSESETEEEEEDEDDDEEAVDLDSAK